LNLTDPKVPKHRDPARNNYCKAAAQVHMPAALLQSQHRDSIVHLEFRQAAHMAQHETWIILTYWEDLRWLLHPVQYIFISCGEAHKRIDATPSSWLKPLSAWRGPQHRQASRN